MSDAPLPQVKDLLQSVHDKKEEQRRLQKQWEDGQTEIEAAAAYCAVQPRTPAWSLLVLIAPDAAVICMHHCKAACCQSVHAVQLC